MNNKHRDEYYARISRLTGDHLFAKTIGVFNAPFVSKTVELMASCGVLGFTFRTAHETGAFYARVWATKEWMGFEEIFVYELKKHNQFEDRWRLNFGRGDENEDIMLAGGSLAICQQAFGEAQKKNIPVVLGALFANGTSAIAAVWPGQDFPFTDCEETLVEADENRYFDWIDLNNQLANIAKAILLDGTEWRRDDIAALLRSGKNTILLAHPDWPWVARYLDLTAADDRQWFEKMVTLPNATEEPKSLKGKTVLIVGLGSLGSIAGEHFRILGCNVIGIDGKDVSIHNPVRQLYGTSYIGDHKAFAFAKMLARQAADALEQHTDRLMTFETNEGTYTGILMDIPDSRYGSTLFSETLERYVPDLVVLTTAHQAEYRMAELCRQKNIPHVIGRCYPRARWFEITNVDGKQGPCFGCLQGHLYVGASPSLTEEQLAIYDTAGDEVNVLQSEPATRVDTSRPADCLSRFSLQFLRGALYRAPWFSRMLREERTCMIGGNFAEFNNESKEWSFGVESPGSVALYGVINFIGSETEETKTCIYCGKMHEVLIKRRNPE